MYSVHSDTFDVRLEVRVKEVYSEAMARYTVTRSTPPHGFPQRSVTTMTRVAPTSLAQGLQSPYAVSNTITTTTTPKKKKKREREREKERERERRFLC